MITITDKAIIKIKEMSEDMDIGHTKIRVKVVGGGCAGFRYDMEYDDKVGELDEVVEKDGITVLVDPMSYQYLEEVTIDYATELMGEGFKFINPAVKASCGCGHSFDF